MVNDNQNRATNATLLNFMTPHDVEVLVARVIDERMKKFYEMIQPKNDPLIKRATAASILGVSLPTIDKYAKHGLLHVRHVGGRCYFLESEIMSYKEVKKRPV